MTEKMERDKRTPPPLPPRNNKSANIVGAVIIFLGIALLLKTMNFGLWFPGWIFGWEMILIIIGLVIGVNSKFEKKSSIILLSIGGLFLLKKVLDLPLGGVIIPMVAISLGIYLILRDRHPTSPPVYPPKPPVKEQDMFDWDKRVDVNENTYTDYESPFQKSEQTNTGQQAEPGTSQQYSQHHYAGENYIKVDSVFGNAKKIIFSKNFLGGTMTNVFGSTEINLLQADLQQPIALDIFQLFGSTKIIVPPHWVIITTVSSILSENDDRRVILTHAVDPNKSLYITGTSIFGNVTIKNS